MSEPERKYQLVLFQEDDDSLDVLHGEVRRDGEGELLGMVHGRSQVRISLDAIRRGDIEVGERVDTEPARLQVTCFDRVRDGLTLRVALVVLEGLVGDAGGQARATARHLDATAIYRRMNQGATE